MQLTNSKTGTKRRLDRAGLQTTARTTWRQGRGVAADGGEERGAAGPAVVLLTAARSEGRQGRATRTAANGAGHNLVSLMSPGHYVKEAQLLLSVQVKLSRPYAHLVFL
ncbi:hypothetical protein VPH35_122864 [Triticum aestivum]